MERKEEEESKRTALADEEDLNEEGEEAGSPTEEGASDDDDDDDDDDDEGSAGKEEGRDDDDDDDDDEGSVGKEEGRDDDDDDDDDEGSAGKEEGRDDDDEIDDEEEKKTLQRAGQDRKCVPGIIYLGHIPPRLRPKHVRNMLSVHGEIGRIFLQPEDRKLRRKKKSGSRQRNFTEGWVEFRDKRVAKRVAASLHNTPMGTRKRQRFYSDLWSIKYLHRFQWTHLSERLAYEQMVLQQRLRTEVSQVKKETNFYLNNVEKGARMDKLKRKREREGQQVEDKTWDFTQRQTEEEIQVKKRKKQLDKARLIQEKSQSNVSLLAKIFNAGKSD
ncbi:activator of basal transcription 1 isoform X3 [Nelusetta ayraudi]